MIEIEKVSQAKTEAFLNKSMGDVAGAFCTIMAGIGDQLGLFKELAQAPATDEELAVRAHINQRYAREWLSAMASSGYIHYDPSTGHFMLPPEHFPVLAQEGGLFFLGGAYQQLMAEVEPRRLLRAFQEGGGVPMEAYPPELWEGQERFSASFYDNLLIPVWLPAMPAVKQKLERGVHVADVGCGRGRALIKLAQHFTRSSYDGYDLFAPSIAAANVKAEQEGVDNRVRFHPLDISQGLPEDYDLITAFDVVHDASDPSKMLQEIRKALRPGGRFICMEASGSDQLEENIGPAGTFFYSISVLYCLTTSLSTHGAGLGTLGLPETTLRDLCFHAGFSRFERVPIKVPFNNLYEISA